jgi:hypothetical protein
MLYGFWVGRIYPNTAYNRRSVAIGRGVCFLALSVFGRSVRSSFGHLHIRF